MPDCVVRCNACGWEGPRSETEKTDLGLEEGGVFDTCPVLNCGSMNVDVFSASGIAVQRQIERVAALQGKPAPSLDEGGA